jgi:hypothetical protein
MTESACCAYPACISSFACVGYAIAEAGFHSTMGERLCRK